MKRGHAGDIQPSTHLNHSEALEKGDSIPHRSLPFTAMGVTQVTLHSGQAYSERLPILFHSARTGPGDTITGCWTTVTEYRPSTRVTLHLGKNSAIAAIERSGRAKVADLRDALQPRGSTAPVRAVAHLPVVLTGLTVFRRLGGSNGGRSCGRTHRVPVAGRAMAHLKATLPTCSSGHLRFAGLWTRVPL